MKCAGQVSQRVYMTTPSLRISIHSQNMIKHVIFVQNGFIYFFYLKGQLAYIIYLFSMYVFNKMDGLM